MDYVDVSVVCLGSTDKAYLFRMEATGREVWIAKSLTNNVDGYTRYIQMVQIAVFALEQKGCDIPKIVARKKSIGELVGGEGNVYFYLPVEGEYDVLESKYLDMDLEGLMELDELDWLIALAEFVELDELYELDGLYEFDGLAQLREFDELIALAEFGEFDGWIR